MEKKMEQAIRELLSGRINALEATHLLDAEIGGITSARWNPGAGQYKIYNHTRSVALPIRGARKKQAEALQELATLAYWKAQRNGSFQAGEIHLGKGCSSKHYKDGFNAYTQKLLTQYAA
jgi:hypothetical protein